MPQANRTLKLSVFKDGALVTESSFTQSEILVGAFARADLRVEAPDAFEMRHFLLRVGESGAIEVENLAGEGRLRFEGAVVETKRDVSAGGKFEVGPYTLLLTVREGASDGAAAFYSASSEDRTERTVGTPALEVAMFWQDALLGVNHYTGQRTVTIGEAKGADYFAPEERLGSKRYDLVVPHGGRHAVNFSAESIEGDVLVGDKIYSVAELKAAGLLTDGSLLVLDSRTRCRLRLDNISYLVSDTVLPPKPKGRGITSEDFQLPIYLSLSLIAHLVLLIIVAILPEEMLLAQRDSHRGRTAMVEAIKIAAEDKEEEEEKADEEKPDEDSKDADGRKTDDKEEEKVSEDTEREDKPKPKDDQLRTDLTPRKLQEHNELIARSTGISKVFDQNTDLIQTMMSDTPGMWGGRQRGLMKIMSIGGGPGEAAGGFYTGSGGLDPFGGSLGGPGGGGFMGTAISDIGSGSGGDDGISGLGKDDGKAGAKVGFSGDARRLQVVHGTYSVTGGLDKETVQRYIRSKMGQIRWCYKTELQKDRALEGKITVQFFISPSGKVSNSKIQASTLGNANVERCIIDKVTNWRFPSSKQGAGAVVSYPFIFKAI